MKCVPDISIIVPVYNAEKTIEHTLDSILKQTLKNIEVIIINDGSTDNTMNLIENYRNKDSRLKVFTQENCGVSRARNKGIEYSTGKYIGFVDADDLVELNMYEVLFSQTQDSTVDIVCCGMTLDYRNIKRKISPCQTPIEVSSIKEKKKYIYEDAYINAYRNGFSECCNKIYSTELIKKNNIYFSESKIYGEDHEFNLDVVTHAKKITMLPNNLYIYNRANQQSVTKSYLNNMINIALEGYETKIMFLKKWKMYESEYINKINYQFILTLKGCIYNEAKGNGSSTVKERISKVKEFRTNRDIREIIKKVDSKYLKINEKINYWILKYTNIQLLFFAYLLKSKIVYLVKRNLF